MLCCCPCMHDPILRSVCDCNAYCWKVACALGVTHTLMRMRDSHLCWVPLAGVPQLGPSLQPLPPQNHNAPGDLRRSHGGTWLAVFDTSGPIPIQPAVWCDPSTWLKGWQLSHTNAATVTGYHVAGLATQMRHLCWEGTDPQRVFNDLDVKTTTITLLLCSVTEGKMSIFKIHCHSTLTSEWRLSPQEKS